MDDAAAPGLSAEDFARLQRGDGVVFRRVYEAYVGLIQYVVRRSGADPALADDLVQETFMRLLRKAGDIQQPSAIKAWLVTTARHLTLDELSRRRRFVPAGDEQTETVDAAFESARRELEVALVGELVEKISREANDGTFADFYVRGRSAKQIAADRGEALSTVTTRLSRLRKRFQDHLRGHIEALRASSPE